MKFIPKSASHPSGRMISNSTLVITRWIAIIGQIAAITVSVGLLDIKLPLFLAGLCILASVFVNLLASIKFGARSLRPSIAQTFLLFDILQLTALLWLTGGLQNPFSLLLLAPVAVGATFLSFRQLIFQILAAILCALLLSRSYIPLQWPDNLPSQLFPDLYIFGLFTASSIAIIFISFYVWRISAQAGAMERAFQITQMALAKEQETASLGALAAATAHELGSPLSTISVITSELNQKFSNGTPPPDELKEDVHILHKQALRCRDILRELGQNYSLRSTKPGIRDVDSLPAQTLIWQLAEKYQRLYPQIKLTINMEGSTKAEKDARTYHNADTLYLLKAPELDFAIGNVLQNAFKFALSEIRVCIRNTNGPYIQIEVEDDGPGFSNSVLKMLGEPYLGRLPDLEVKSEAQEPGSLDDPSIAGQSGLGLGIFIAQTLLHSLDSQIFFSNRDYNHERESIGAKVIIHLHKDSVAIQS